MPETSRLDDAPLGELHPHEVLGLSPREKDAVKVIEAAQSLLQRWRRVTLGASGAADRVPGHPAIDANQRIREIKAARQAMLERIQVRRWFE